jgi:DNA-binding NarL/FixJ family response regulator
VALDSPLDELRDDLDRARNGGATVSARFQHLMMDALRERGEHSEEKALSPRQASIIKLVADGVSTAEIADMLSISPLTVKSHYSGINEKLGVSSKAAAVAEAFRRGILS